MAAAKPEVQLYQSTNELATKFQRLYPCFWGSQLNYVICIITGSYFLLKIQDGGLQTGNTIISACG